MLLPFYDKMTDLFVYPQWVWQSTGYINRVYIYIYIYSYIICSLKSGKGLNQNLIWVPINSVDLENCVASSILLSDCLALLN